MFYTLVERYRATVEFNHTTVSYTHLADRKGIFFVDAKDGFVKDGNKNRLREQDIKRIVDTWNARHDVPWNNWTSV